jgi:hypothetical protein
MEDVDDDERCLVGVGEVVEGLGELVEEIR